MQQTTTYKLNKPESTDTFSVSPLNENADTLEAQLARLDGADAAEAAARQALDQRVTALEVHKIVVGTYTGNAESGTNASQIIQLGFTPVAVFLQMEKQHSPYFLTAFYDKKYSQDQKTIFAQMVDGGFLVAGDKRYGEGFNAKDYKYSFLALA